MFQLQLKNSTPIDVGAIVRTLPNKREVLRGEWSGHAVYAKKFFGHESKKYLDRDIAGVMFLANAGLLTPKILFQGEARDEPAYVLIFAEILDSVNAEQAWTNADGKARFILAERLVYSVAQHHNANLLQTDLHLKNFLIQHSKIYTLDGDGIRQYKALSRCKALRNLCILLSKFNVLDLEERLPDLLKTYAEARGWGEAPDSARMKKCVHLQRSKVASTYADKKVFRQCTDVSVVKTSTRFSALASDYSKLDLPQTPTALDVLFQPHQIIKNGRTCSVATVTISEKKIVIKRYNIKSFWHVISRSLRKTRAAVSWANAHRLKLLKIATANPIALIETHEFGLRGKAYFLTEYIDAPNVAEYFAQTNDKVLRAVTVKHIALLFYQLYLLQISHGDMKATNIKILDNKPVLIDLDSMQQHRFDWSALRAHVRDLRRFMQNWQADASLYNAFAKEFEVIYKDHAPLIRAHILETKS